MRTEPRQGIRHLGKIAAYALSSGGMGVVTLTVIPVVITTFGPTAWGSIAVGQAVGTGLAVLVAFGWNTTGPPLIATATEEGRRRFYAQSLKVQLTLAVPASGIAVLVCWFVAADRLVATVTALSLVLTGVMAHWFFTGAGKPFSVLVFDALPRMLGTIVGGIAVLAGADLIVLPLVQLSSIVVAICVSAAVISPFRELRALASEDRLSCLLRRQSDGLLIAAVTAAYISLPVVVVASVAPAGLASFALVDKLLRFATTALSPLVQFLQGWVPRPDPGTTERRVRLSLRLAVVVAVISSCVFVVLVPWMARVLSGGTIQPGFVLTVIYGGILFLLVTSQIVGLIGLLAMKQGRALARYAATGAMVGLPAVLVGAHLFGAEGAAGALVLAETVALTLEVRLLLVTLAQHGRGRAREAAPRL